MESLNYFKICKDIQLDEMKVGDFDGKTDHRI